MLQRTRTLLISSLFLLFTACVHAQSGFSEMGLPGAMPPAFKFRFSRKAPPEKFLPAPPKRAAKLPPWTNEDLGRVAEVAFSEPLPHSLGFEKAFKETAHTIAKINHVNARTPDAFMEALMAHRADLRGLPFLLGDACRSTPNTRAAFAMAVVHVNQCLLMASAPPPGEITPITPDKIWTDIDNARHECLQQNKLPSAFNGPGAPPAEPQIDEDHVNSGYIAALMQILMPKSEQMRLGLAKYLATIRHRDATQALAKLALYAPEESVRGAAVAGLMLRRERDYTDILMQGFRYPLPVVAKRAAEALVKLERTDILADLVDVLDKPDPRLPAIEKRPSGDVLVVRELVRINHHRNCLLCHAPGNGDTPADVEKFPVPLPSLPLPEHSPFGGYGMNISTDTVVRIDMTYLRQDFSVMMHVDDASPWPFRQRFDFLMRTRAVTPDEAQRYELPAEAGAPGWVSPYRRAALFALRELSGRDAEPSAGAWRQLLNSPKRP